MVPAYSNNGSEKGSHPHHQSGRNQVASSRCKDWGMIRAALRGIQLRRYLLFGHTMRSWNSQPRPKICGRLDLDVIMLLHIYLIPDCGGPACGGVDLVLDFSPEALLQLNASKAYSKGPFFSGGFLPRFADSAQRRCDDQDRCTSTTVQRQARTVKDDE